MKKKVIIGLMICLVIGGFITFNILKSKGSIGAFGGGSGVDIKVEKVEKGEISSVVSSSGVIEEVEKSEVYFDTPLKVKKVLVEKNQKVNKGDKLLEVDMDSMYSELNQQRINKSVQEYNIEKFKSSNGNTSIQEASVIIAENDVKSAENAYNDSKNEYDKNKSLYEAGAIPKSDFEKIQKQYEESNIALNNAKLRHQTAASSNSIDLSIQHKNLEATNMKIQDLENNIAKVNESVLSPINGSIISVDVENGSLTSSIQPTFKIVNLDKLRITADVKEYNIKSVNVGQDVKIYGDAVSKDDGVIGKITSISPMAKKNQTSTGDETLIEVMISIDKYVPVLKPGLSVTCDIITQVKKDALIGSFEMLSEDKDGNKSVYIFDEKSGTMDVKPVKLGINSELSVELIDGVNDGDLIILNPLPNFKSGMKAKITKE